MQYLLQNERKYLCEEVPALSDPRVDALTRRIIVQWMIRVHEKFELSCGTIFLAVNIFDRMLKGHSYHRRTTHVLATASLFCASKY